MTQLSDPLSGMTIGGGLGVQPGGPDFSFGQTPVAAAAPVQQVPPPAAAAAAAPAAAAPARPPVDRRVDPTRPGGRPPFGIGQPPARPPAAAAAPAAAPPPAAGMHMADAPAEDDPPNPSNLDPELLAIADLVARAIASSETRARQVAYDAVFNDDRDAQQAVGQIKARLMLLREIRGRLAMGVGEVRTALAA